jgi:di/tricarboxylate transporter
MLGLRLIQRHGVTLLGVSRQGKRFRERVRHLPIKAGDLLLLIGPTTTSPPPAPGSAFCRWKTAGLR